MSKECLQCKVDISHKDRSAKYCSARCRIGPRFRGTYCKNCGNELVVYATSVKKIMYCSNSCRYIAKYPNFNENYFATPNLTNSYWAGFIAADGCILTPSAGQRIMAIELKAADQPHLDRMQDDIGAGTVRSHSRIIKATGALYSGATYQLRSNKICDDLGSNFNIFPRKTLTHGPPNLEGNLAHAFIAGYIDGDGSYVRHDTRPRLSVVGTKNFLTWMLGIYDINKIPVLRNGIYQVQLNGNDAINVRKSFEQLDLPLLDRKKSRWEELGLNLSLL